MEKSQEIVIGAYHGSDTSQTEATLSERVAR